MRRQYGLFFRDCAGACADCFWVAFCRTPDAGAGCDGNDSSLCKGLWTVHIAGGADYVRFLCDEQYFSGAKGNPCLACWESAPAVS